MIELRTPDDWAAWLAFIDWLGDLVDDLNNRLEHDDDAEHWWDA